MGNTKSILSLIGPGPSDFVNENIWFAIKMETFDHWKGKNISGFLRYPQDDKTWYDTEGYCLLDPNSLETINKVASGQPNLDFVSGYCWKVASSKGGVNLHGRGKDGNLVPMFSFYKPWFPGFFNMATLGTSSTTTLDILLNLEELSKGTLKFYSPNERTGSDFKVPYLGSFEFSNAWTNNTPYGAVYFEDGKYPTTLTVYQIDLSNKSTPIISNPIPNGPAILADYKNYSRWYYTLLRDFFWKNGTTNELKKDAKFNLLESYAISLPPEERAKFVWETQRCERMPFGERGTKYADGEDLWSDELCRISCNGDFSTNSIKESTKYCAPYIGNKITTVTKRVPGGPPNDFIRSKLGRAYCSENPGACSDVLSAWCSDDTPDKDGKYVLGPDVNPFGKRGMCACSWSKDVKIKKIRENNKGLAQLLDSGVPAITTIAQKMLNNQMNFVCEDPECVTSRIYKNQADLEASKTCPSNQYQVCMTSVTINNSGKIEIGEQPISQNCEQQLTEVYGSGNIECLKRHGTAYLSNGEYLCCENGSELVKDSTGKDVCLVKCKPGELRKEDGTCSLIKPCNDGQDYVNGVCVQKCKPNESRVNGECVLNECGPGKEKVNDECLNRCNPDEKRDDKGRCYLPFTPIIPPGPKPPTPGPKPGPDKGQSWEDWIKENQTMLLIVVAIATFAVAMFFRS